MSWVYSLTMFILHLFSTFLIKFLYNVVWLKSIVYLSILFITSLIHPSSLVIIIIRVWLPLFSSFRTIVNIDKDQLLSHSLRIFQLSSMENISFVLCRGYFIYPLWRIFHLFIYPPILRGCSQITKEIGKFNMIQKIVSYYTVVENKSNILT